MSHKILPTKYCMAPIYTKKIVFVVYLKFKTNETSCILSGNAIQKLRSKNFILSQTTS